MSTDVVSEALAALGFPDAPPEPEPPLPTRREARERPLSVVVGDPEPAPAEPAKRDPEAGLLNGITVVVGAVAGVFSFSNVIDLAAKHHVGHLVDEAAATYHANWRSVAVAICVESLAIAAGLEIRRRRRAGLPLGFAPVVLIAAASLQFGCQLADAEASVWGWLLAGAPSATFLTLVSMALHRSKSA